MKPAGRAEDQEAVAAHNGGVSVKENYLATLHGMDGATNHNERNTIMSNLRIGRYTHESVTSEYAGYIEPDDRSWIIWLNADGKPALYYAEREPSGAVTGMGVRLDGDVTAE